MPLVLSELVGHAKGVWKLKRKGWVDVKPEASEMAAAEKEATTGTQFDRLGLKAGIWNAYKGGQVRLVCKQLGSLARVLAFLPHGVQEPNWEFWEHVFKWFGPSKDAGPWRVTYFASEKQREFPMIGQDLGAEHVNGGYTTPCSTAGIFIYRAEEATRVLIHEMMHAACLDEQTWSIPEREAMVETWAELILIALKSKGGRPSAKRLWVAQSHWVADTNWKAKNMNNTHDISDYGWRYLCGREPMYARLGIALPAPRHTTIQSLRFTHPMLEV